MYNLKKKITITNIVDLQILDSHLISLERQNTIYKILNKQINKGGRIMRTRDEINRDLKTSIVDLNLLVEASVKNEQDFEERRNGFEDHIRALDMEVPFEDTLKGKIKELEDKKFKEITSMLDELAEVTGRVYCFSFTDVSNT